MGLHRSSNDDLSEAKTCPRAYCGKDSDLTNKLELTTSKFPVDLAGPLNLTVKLVAPFLSNSIYQPNPVLATKAHFSKVQAGKTVTSSSNFE